MPVSFHAAGVTRERSMRIVPTAGWLLVVELCNLAMYASGRVILGAYRSPASVGLYEGRCGRTTCSTPGGALAVPVVPTASRYVAGGDERRLRELAVRGSRYTLALFVPAVRHADRAGRADPRGVAGRPLRGRRCRAGHARLLLAALRRADGHPGVPGGGGPGAFGRSDLRRRRAPIWRCAGAHARARARGAGAGHGDPVRRWLSPVAAGRAGGVRASLGELARVAWLPAYVLGAVLAGLLVAARAGLSPESLPAVLALAGGGVLAYWAALYALVLSGEERASFAAWSAVPVELAQQRRAAVALRGLVVDSGRPFDAHVGIVEAVPASAAGS